MHRKSSPNASNEKELIRKHYSEPTDAGDIMNCDVLLCKETLQRMSPEIWREKVAGLREMIVKNRSIEENDRREWEEITIKDKDLVALFANMKTGEIMAKIKDFLNEAFQLQIEEEKEINRARIIDVFGGYDNKNVGKQL